MKEEVAWAEVKDTGKPIWEARFDIDGCIDTMEYYAGLAATIAGMLPTCGASLVGLSTLIGSQMRSSANA